MKKLKIVFKDGSQIIYTMKNCVSWVPYFARHDKTSMKSAVLQQYPKKNNKPVILVAEFKCDYCKNEISEEHLRSKKFKRQPNGKYECLKCFVNGRHKEDYPDDLSIRR